MNGPRNSYILTALLVLVASAFLPKIFLDVSRYANEKERLIGIAQSFAINTAKTLSLGHNIVDHQVADTMKDIKEAFSDTRRDIVDWSKIFAARLSTEYLFHDILIVEPDGFVLASGRMDSPLSVAALMETIDEIPLDLTRMQAYGERPYDNYVLPYISGIEPDKTGKATYAILLLLRSDIYTEAAETLDIRDDIGIDISIIDRTGLIVFRHPQPTHSGRRDKGQRIPIEDWQKILDGPKQGAFRTKMGDGEAYCAGYSKLTDENGDTYAVTQVSVREQDLLRRFGSASYIRYQTAAILLILSACISAALIARRKILLPLERGIAAAWRQKHSATPAGLAKDILDTDFVTGLYNRRAGFEIAESLRELSISANSIFSIAIVDIDDFRTYNERYGTKAGDDILKETAKAIRGTLRENDTVFRYGGDEFMLLLPGCPLAKAEILVHRIEHKLASIFKQNDERPSVNVSIGFAEFKPAPSSSLDELIVQAKADLGTNGEPVKPAKNA